MPNNITWSAKQRYPQYDVIPDDELTLKYAEAHPQYLSDPEFKADYDRIMLSKQAAVPQPAPEPEAGLGESIARRAYGGLNVLGGGLWKAGEYVSRAVGATDTAEEARLNYEYAKAEADAQRAKSAQTGIGKYAGMVAEALPSILPAIAVAPAGLAGMAVASGVTGGASTLGTAEDAYKAKYLKEGFSEEEAAAKARISALAPAAASGLATGLITRGFGAKGVEALASQAVTREAAKKLITQSLPSAFVRGATSEAIEEAVDQGAQAIIERVSYNPELTLGQAFEQVRDAFIVGGALGGGVAGLRHPGEVRQAQAIVTQERKEAAAVAAAEASAKADRESQVLSGINAAIERAGKIQGERDKYAADFAAAQERIRRENLGEYGRTLEDIDRIEAENEPIRLAQHEIDDRIRAEKVAKYKREKIDAANQEAYRTYRAEQGYPSLEEIAAAEAELKAVAPTAKQVVADEEKQAIKGATREDVEASQRLAAAAAIPYPFTSQPTPQPIIQVTSPRNLKVVEGGKLDVKQEVFPVTPPIEGQPLPKPSRGDVGIQEKILTKTGYSTLARGLGALPSANLPKPTNLRTKKQALVEQMRLEREAEANRQAQLKHEADQAEWSRRVEAGEAAAIVYGEKLKVAAKPSQKKPVKPAAIIPTAATPQEAAPSVFIPSDTAVRSALSSNQVEFVGAHRNVKEGTPVGLRVDINAARRGTDVITVHEKARGGSVGKRIGYDSIATVDNPVFKSNVSKAVKIHEGESKTPMATVEGQFNRSREIPSDIGSWTKVGFNPHKHSYFYDRDKGEVVVSGSKAISVGNTVFVKDPVYGKKSDFPYSLGEDATSVPSGNPEMVRSAAKDVAYLAAIGRGDMATAQRLVDEAARDAGYTIEGWHGNEVGEINRIDRPFWVSESKREATAYSEITDVDAIKIKSEIDPRNSPEKVPDSFDMAEAWPIAEDFVGNPGLLQVESGTGRIFFWNGETNPVGDNSLVFLKGIIADPDTGIVKPSQTEDTSSGIRKDYNPFVGRYWLRGRFYDAGDSRFRKEEAPSAANLIGERLSGKAELVQKWRNFLNSRGYDGVSTFSDEAPSVRQYVVFEPSAIKSAAPVTRDEYGNVIPLSSRFSPINADTRFGLGVGEQPADSSNPDMVRSVAKDVAPNESVRIVYEPDHTSDGRIVEAYVDSDGIIVLNTAAPRMGNASHVRKVMREEMAHKLLSSDEGRAAVNGFVGRLTPQEVAELQAQGYLQQEGESDGDYKTRLHDEYIAKQARENTTKWGRIVDGARRFMARFGLRLNNAEVARAILRQLSDPSTANYSVVDRFREKFITNYAFFDALQDKAESITGKKLPYRLIHAFEQTSGASGKAKAEYRELRDAVEQLVPDKIKEFETMASLLDARGRFAEAIKIRAEIARLEAGPMDVKTSTKIQALKDSLPPFEDVVHNHERMTARIVEAKIAALEGELSADGSLRDVMKALDVYRNYMHKNAEMKHASGLISDKELARYKSAYFYMPRVNTSVREELPGYSSGKGRVGQTNTKDVYLDALDAAHHLFNKDFARADKNKAILLFRDAMNDPVLRHLAEVVDKKSASGGFVTGYDGGQEFYIKTDPSIAATVNFSVGGINDLTEIARAISSVQRFGAITASLPFQFFNFFANDLPNLALMSNAGIKSPKEFVMFFQSLWEGFDIARSGNFGKLSQAHQDWLRSSASTSFSSAMRDTFKVGDFKEGGFFDYISRIGQMVEETSKIAGMRMLLKRAGVKNISELSPEDAINLRNEVRNFAGSPDFLRGGSFIKSARVGVWLPFIPAAIQGQSTAMRLFDFSESRSAYEKDAANAARIRVGFVVGTAVYAAYAMNHLTDELEREYDKIPDEVKRNNFMFPQFTYRTASDGSKVMNYFRFPKKGFIKLISNPIEDSMDFYKKTDAAHFSRMLAGAAESILPVDITGEKPEDRLMGLLSSANPAQRVIAEFATNKSFYRRGDIVPQRMKDVKATEQYTERTNDDVKAVATLIGMSPLKLRNALDGMTGGIAGTLLPEKSLEGDRGLAKVPIINRLTWSASRDQGESDLLDKYKEAGATESLNRFREADAFVKARKGMDARSVIVEAASRYGQENRDIWEKVRELVIARDRGLNAVDMRVLQLPPKQRAQYILHELGRLPEQSRADYINDARKKHILTRETAKEMYHLGFRWN